MTIFFLLAFLGPPASLLWGWSSYRKGFLEPRWRARLGLGTLVLATLLTAGYLSALLRLAAIPEFGDKVNSWLYWSRIGVRLAIGISLVALLSKDRFRWATLACCVTLAFLSAAVYLMK